MQKNILNKCFKSSSRLWNEFVNSEGDLITLYYPSAHEDLRPFVFSKNEALEYMGLNLEAAKYEEPNFFIFSDYFPFSNSRFFDKKTLFNDNYTYIDIEDFCEIKPVEDNYQYQFNQDYVHFSPSLATGKAIFFKAKIHSHKVEAPYFFRYAIYFFYENTNLIDQLFLRNNFYFSHVVWKRDGSGLGGGRISLQFLYPIAAKNEARFFFLWNHYQDEDNPKVNLATLRKEEFPSEIKRYIIEDFELTLKKKICMNWDGHDKMNFYLKD